MNKEANRLNIKNGLKPVDFAEEISKYMKE